MTKAIINANIILEDGIIFDGALIINDGKIAGYGKMGTVEIPEGAEILDAHGLYVGPGFVDIHCHGGNGSKFENAPVEAARHFLAHGETSVLATLYYDLSPEDMTAAIDLIQKTIEDGTAPNIAGIYMEGPYLNVDMCGGIDPKYIRNPDPEEYEEWLALAKGAIARWTVAVELDGAEQFIKRLCQEGVLPSVGHSCAEYCQVKEAFDWGVTHTTHLYSVMSTITRKSGFRHSGVLESAYCIPDMTVEVIADGCHLPTELLEFVYRVKGPDKVALTCDSMRCAGQDLKESIIGSREKGQRVIIEDDVAKMPDRNSFAGSIATDDRLIRVMHQKVGIPLWDAVKMMTLTPARIIGLGEKKGSISVGKDADLICFDSQIQVKGAMVCGKGITGIFA